MSDIIHYTVLAGYPLRVCDLYERIIILIIIIISLGQILLSYIANTSHMQAHTHTVVAVQVVAVRWVSEVNAPFCRSLVH